MSQRRVAVRENHVVRTLIAGGGTGGHLTPALAVAQALRRADPGGDVLLVGRRGGLEETLVPSSGLRLETLNVRGIDLGSPLRLPGTAVRIGRGTLQALRIVRRFRPDVVVGAAGYVSVPVVTAALLRRIPVVLLEQNAHPGRTTRLFARRSRAVAASFAETAALLPGAHVV